MAFRFRIFVTKAFFFFFFLWLHYAAYGILVPQQGSNPRPLHWKCGVLTTGPPGKSHKGFFFKRILLIFSSLSIVVMASLLTSESLILWGYV